MLEEYCKATEVSTPLSNFSPSPMSANNRLDAISDIYGRQRAILFFSSDLNFKDTYYIFNIITKNIDLPIFTREIANVVNL
jgi:hypothetical protein